MLGGWEKFDGLRAWNGEGEIWVVETLENLVLEVIPTEGRRDRLTRPLFPDHYNLGLLGMLVDHGYRLQAIHEQINFPFVTTIPPAV